MKLIIKEIERKTNKVYGKWTWKFKSIDECFKVIKKLDSQYSKHYFRFKYIIRED